MKLMKKKGREREEARKKIINKSLSVVIAAVFVSSVLIASMPLAAAKPPGNIFEIEPCRSEPGEVLAYDVTIIHTAGFNSLTMSIPMGFGAVAPEDEDLLAEAWALDDGGSNYYMTFTANGTDKIDLYCECGEVSVEYTFNASYDPGDSINISVSCFGSAYANLTLPPAGENGSLEMSLGGSSKKLKKVTISIQKFVQNPAICDPYTFDLTANGYSDSYTVCIMYPGDINGDSKVNVLDLQRMAWAWGSELGQANYNPCADLSCDGKLSVADLQLLAWNILNEYPPC